MSSPRILLFGTRGAGKSSLLGALAQAAPALKAELIEQSGELEELQKKTYASKPAPTEKLEAYDIKLKHAEAAADFFLSRVTVLDCSGQTAREMLQAAEPFADSHPLMKPILDADAVVLVIDASLTGKQLNAEFKQCAHWLKELHAFRGRHCGIAELPVYFVLAKCDLLVLDDDTAGAWINRIEEFKGKFDANLRKFLKKQEPGFGTVNLKLSATAIKRPAFTDKPARAQEPFGVAELFRECLQSAGDFQERRHLAQGRLQNVVAGLIGLVLLLVLSLVFLSEFQPPTKGTTLDEQAQAVLPKPGATPLERVQGSPKKLEEKLNKLVDIESDARFESLPDETQDSVRAHRQELAEYLQLQQKAQTALKLPYEANNDEQLQKLQKTALGFSLPEARAQDWEETRVGRTMRHVRKEYETLQAALKDEDDWLHGQIEMNNELFEQGSLLLGRFKKDKEALQEAKQWQQAYRTQFKAEIPTSGKDKVPGVTRVFYDDLGKFEPVKATRQDWTTSKDALKGIADLILKKQKSG